MEGIFQERGTVFSLTREKVRCSKLGSKVVWVRQLPIKRGKFSLSCLRIGDLRFGLVRQNLH